MIEGTLADAVDRVLEHWLFALAQDRSSERPAEGVPARLAAHDGFMMHARAALSALHAAGLVSDRDAQSWQQSFDHISEVGKHPIPLASDEVRALAEWHLEGLLAQPANASQQADELNAAISGLAAIRALDKPGVERWRTRHHEARHPGVRRWTPELAEQLAKARPASTPTAAGQQPHVPPKLGRALAVKVGPPERRSGLRILFVTLFENALTVHWHQLLPRTEADDATDIHTRHDRLRRLRDQLPKLTARDEYGNLYQTVPPGAGSTTASQDLESDPIVLRGATLLTPAVDRAAHRLEINHDQNVFHLAL